MFSLRLSISSGLEVHAARLVWTAEALLLLRGVAVTGARFECVCVCSECASGVGVWCVIG